MKPGHAGTVVVLVSGAILGGAVVAKDGAQLGRARKLLHEGESALAAGKAKEAQASFREALASALVVGGITGQRPAALEVAGEARRNLRVCEAVLLAEHGDPTPLDVLDDAAAKGGPTKDVIDKVVAKELAHEQELTAEALEKTAVDADLRSEQPSRTRAELHRLAEKGYELAQKAIAAAGGAEEERIKNAIARSHARYLVQAALAANASDQGAEAHKLAEEGQAALEAAANAFQMPEGSPSGGVKEREALRAFVRGIVAEGSDRKRVNDFEEQVKALDARVDTKDLGTLLPEVVAVKEPTLEGGHRAVSELEKKLGDARARLTLIRATAEQFHDMVLAVNGTTTKVYVDRTEVTNAEFKKFVDEKHPYTEGKTAEVWGSDAAVKAVEDFIDSKAKDLGPGTWAAGTFPPGQEQHPVAGVSAVEARAFARSRGKRLPTYGEWKSAAGVVGAAVQSYPWGESWKEGGGNVLTGTTAGGTTAGGTKPVGQFPGGRAPTGAEDMVGNVREVVEDPAGVLAVGGSYESKPDAATLRSALRVEAEARPRDQGFRCAKELTWTR